MITFIIFNEKEKYKVKAEKEVITKKFNELLKNHEGKLYEVLYNGTRIISGAFNANDINTILDFCE